MVWVGPDNGGVGPDGDIGVEMVGVEWGSRFSFSRGT